MAPRTLSGTLQALARVEQERDEVRDALREVVRQFDMWSDDANDGEFAYYRSDGLMIACVAARATLARKAS